MSNDLEYEDMVAEIERDIETKVLQNTDLDLKSFGDQQLADLDKFKKRRSDMIDKREALKKAIKILDKRIAISLDAIRILQIPTKE